MNGNDTDSDVYHVTYGSEGPPPSVAVVEAMAAVVEADPLDLDPLADVVDVDCLNRLFDPTTPMTGGTRVTFTYHDHEVTVNASGSIRIRPLDGDA